MNNVPRMLGLKEAATEFSLSYNAVRQMALRGAIPAVRIGKGKILVNADGIAAYLNSAKLTDNAVVPATVGGIRVLK